VARSLSFYLMLLEPLGFDEYARYPTYRGTEEVVYLKDRNSGDDLGLRPADGGEHRYYGVGIELLAFRVDDRAEVDEAHQRCVEAGASIHFPPEEDRDIEGYYGLFVFDPDGMRIEVFSWPGAEEALTS
jgi:catechol 2,3-dioxygenase-like lactoylglutathione lyase family enzyme